MTNVLNWLKVTAKEVKELHTNDDLDSGVRAHHHTLGTGINQAARGSDLKVATETLDAVQVLIAALDGRVDILEALILPVGHIHLGYYAGAPTNYLKCDGSPFSGVTYPALAALLGGTNTPDLRDRVPVGASGTKAVGALNGSDTVVIGSANLPPHVHSLNNHTHGMAHTHSMPSRATATAFGTAAVVAQPSVSGTLSAGVSTNAASPNVTDPAGGNTDNGGFANTAMDVKPKSLALNFFIKAL